MRPPIAHHDGALVSPEEPALGEEVRLSLWVGPEVASAQLRAAPDGEEELWPLELAEELGSLRRLEVRLRWRWPEARYRFR
ncbi:MAG: hypothetical protein ACYCWW_08345, partial [Deltaproteobacteria bacterium]